MATIQELPPLIGYSELEELFGTSREALYKMTARGELPAIRVTRRTVRFSRDEILAMLEQRRAAAPSVTAA